MATMNGPTSITRRILRDGALRGLPIWLGIMLLAGNLMAATAIWRAVRLGSSAPPYYLLVLTLWLPITAFLLLGKSRARGHRLELAMPIPARQLWLAHSMAMACAAAVMLAAGLGMMNLVGMLLARGYQGPDPALMLLPLAPPIAAATALGIVLVQRTQPGAWKPTSGGGGWGRLIAGLVLIPVVLLALEPWPLLATGLLVLLSGVLGYRAWTSLPAALELTPMTERAKRPAGSARQTDAAAPSSLAGSPPGRAVVPRLLFKVLHNAPPWRQAMPWLLYFFILLIAFFLAGGFGIWVDLDESRLLNMPLGAYMLFTGAGILSYHLYRLDPLPISRATLFRIMVLPSLFFFCLGWGAGRLALGSGHGSRNLVDYRIAGEQQWVQIDPAYMGISTSGEAPMLDAPWGESHPAWHRPLFRGSRVVVYSPFNTPEPSSARFEALMTSRAIQRVYGEAIPADEISSRYFEVVDDEIVALKGAGLTLSADYPTLSPPARASGTPVYMTLTLVPWLLLVAGFTRSFRATASLRFIRAVYYVILGVLLVALLGQTVAAILQIYSPAAAYGLLTIFCQWIAADPLATTVAWLLCAALVYLAYRLALGQFRRAELPVSPLQCALVDFGKGG